MKIRPYYLFIIFLLAVIAAELIYPRLIFSSTRTAYVMGTPLRIKVEGRNSPYYTQIALQKIKRLDRAFSRFNPESEISLVNRLAGQAPVEVSADTFECLKLADQMSRLSYGAFDVTLGNAYALVLRENQRKVYLRKKGVSIDLGAIGKGFAVEAARKLLLEKGAKSGMIDLRSSLAVFGPRTWRVGVQHPRRAEELLEIIELNHGESLATSGDYERGKHIIDPRTGQAATACRSVTIIGRDAAESDALATAVFVLGPSVGMRLIEYLPEVDGIIVDEEGNVSKSSGFKRL